MGDQAHGPVVCLGMVNGRGDPQSRDSSISPAIELAFNRPTAAYFKSMRAIDSLIDLYDRATTSITCDMRFP